MVIGVGKSPDTYSSQQINLASRWAEMGHNVDLFTLSGQGLESVDFGPNFRIRLCPGFIPTNRGIPLMLGVKNELQRKSYDFILVSEHYQPATAMACLASENAIIYQGQNSPGSSLPSKLILMLLESTFGRISRRKCAGVIAKTDKAASFVTARGYSPVEVIPCGYDETHFFPPSLEQREKSRASLGLEPDEVILVYAGNLLPRRDVGSIIRALAMLESKRRKVRLLVAGEGPQLEPLKSLGAALGIAEKVVFLGLLPRSRLRDVYWAGDFFILGSHYEIFGLVILEAMACGLLVISTPVGAAADIIRDNHNGFIFPIGAAGTLANTLNKVIDSSKLLTRIKEVALRDVQVYAWPTIAQRIVTFANSLSLRA